MEQRESTSNPILRANQKKHQLINQLKKLSDLAIENQLDSSLAHLENEAAIMAPFNQQPPDEQFDPFEQINDVVDQKTDGLNLNQLGIEIDLVNGAPHESCGMTNQMTNQMRRTTAKIVNNSEF